MQLFDFLDNFVPDGAYISDFQFPGLIWAQHSPLAHVTAIDRYSTSPAAEYNFRVHVEFPRQVYVRDVRVFSTVLLLHWPQDASRVIQFCLAHNIEVRA